MRNRSMLDSIPCEICGDDAYPESQDEYAVQWICVLGHKFEWVNPDPDGDRLRGR